MESTEVGGGLVAVIVFTVAVGALIAAVLMGVKAPEFLDPKAEDKEDPGLAD